MLIRAEGKKCTAVISDAVTEEWSDLLAMGFKKEANERRAFYGSLQGPKRIEEHVLIQNECNKLAQARFVNPGRATPFGDLRSLFALGLTTVNSQRHPITKSEPEQTALRIAEQQKCDQERIHEAVVIVHHDPFQEIAEKKGLPAELKRCSYEASALYPEVKAKVQYGPMQLK